jgi:hypothetical protein
MSDSNPAALSLGQVFKLLTVGQAWSLGAAIVCVIGGAFALGLHLAAYKTDRCADSLEKSAAEVQALRYRVDFFTAYTRFLIARQKDYESVPGAPPISADTYDGAQSLADVIARWYYQTSRDNDVAKYDPGSSPLITKGYGGTNDSHLTFRDRQDTWPIPGLVKGFVLERRHAQ